MPLLPRRPGAGRGAHPGVRGRPVRPQGGNRQPVRWVVVRDGDRKRRLAEWYLGPWKAYLAGIEAARSASVRYRRPSPTPTISPSTCTRWSIAVLCAELDGLHPTDLDLGRFSVVGGGSIYPTAQNFCLALRDRGSQPR